MTPAMTATSVIEMQRIKIIDSVGRKQGRLSQLNKIKKQKGEKVRLGEQRIRRRKKMLFRETVSSSGTLRAFLLNQCLAGAAIETSMAAAIALKYSMS